MPFTNQRHQNKHRASKRDLAQDAVENCAKCFCQEFVPYRFCHEFVLTSNFSNSRSGPPQPPDTGHLTSLEVEDPSGPLLLQSRVPQPGWPQHLVCRTTVSANCRLEGK